MSECAARKTELNREAPRKNARGRGWRCECGENDWYGDGDGGEALGDVAFDELEPRPPLPLPLASGSTNVIVTGRAAALINEVRLPPFTARAPTAVMYLHLDVSAFVCVCVCV